VGDDYEISVISTCTGSIVPVMTLKAFDQTHFFVCLIGSIKSPKGCKIIYSRADSTRQ
jgi:hypothetical protein